MVLTRSVAAMVLVFSRAGADPIWGRTGWAKRSFRDAREIAIGQQKPDYWSQHVTEHSTALDLEEGVFTWDDPARIARSLKRSAEASTRRKGTPLQSAMSMLNFYINRAGSGLADDRRRVLDQQKSSCARLSAGVEAHRRCLVRRRSDLLHEARFHAVVAELVDAQR